MAHDPPATRSLAPPSPASEKRIAIYVVAHNAATSLVRVLERIPAAVRGRVTEILVFDAASRDDTYLVGMGYKTVSRIDNLTVLRGDESADIGANNKRAIAYCRERGYDVMVLLHGDGKYAPEVIDRLLDPLERGEVDAVCGSRFLDGHPLRDGMPLHKWLAVRVLSALQRRLVGLDLTDWHCGYRAYAVAEIAALPYTANSDGLHFDTEILIQMKQKGLRVAEVPVPAYSGTEADSVRGVRYATNVIRVLGQYWVHAKGLREYPKFAGTEKYGYKRSRDGSHEKILALVDRDRQRILDVGCGAGYLAEALAVRGNTVVGVDARRVPGVEQRVERFLEVDLDRERIAWVGPAFGLVVLGDVLEHLREPAALLSQCRELLTEDGALIVSVPNVAHWSVRLALLFGRFPYAAKGICDRSHLRFYTLATIRAELEHAGFRVDRVETTPVPLEDLVSGRIAPRIARGLAWLQALANRAWKGLFAYQLVLRARKTPT